MRADEVPLSTVTPSAIADHAIIGDGLFIRSLGLGQLPAVEENARAVFIGVGHTGVLERKRAVCYRAARHDGSHKLQEMWERIYLSLL